VFLERGAPGAAARQVERDAVRPAGRGVHARDAVPRRERAGERLGGDVLRGVEVTRDDRHRREQPRVLGAVPRREGGLVGHVGHFGW
jgi:hypothetical protein